MEIPDYLPLSMLNQLLYCPRRFWYMFVQGEMLVNAPVLEGTFQHEHAHTAGQMQEKGQVKYRRLYVWSDRWRISGFCDVVEEREGKLVPLEYKRGKMGKWINDHVQLCAQALCLEERSGQAIPYGEIFYWRSRRRQRVALGPDLRQKTQDAIARAFQLLQEGRLPPPLEKRAKCADCSLAPVCLPREVQMLNALQTSGS